MKSCPRCKQSFIHQMGLEYQCLECLEHKGDSLVRFGIDFIEKSLRCLVLLDNNYYYLSTDCSNTHVRLSKVNNNTLYIIGSAEPFSIEYNLFDNLILDHTLYEQLCKFAEKMLKLQVFS